MNAEAALVLQGVLAGEGDAAQVRACVAGLGGWPAVIAEWRAAGGESATVASLSEVRGVLLAEAEVIAEHLGSDEEVVKQIAFAIEWCAACGDVGRAAGIASWVAEVFAVHLDGARDPGVQRAREWWATRWGELKGADSVR